MKQHEKEIEIEDSSKDCNKMQTQGILKNKKAKSEEYTNKEINDDEETKSEDSGSNQAYFWKPEECTKFIMLMQKFGKSWINVCKELDNRNSL